MTSDGRVKIADFGVSRQLSSSVNYAETMVGTPAFAAPEVGRVVRSLSGSYTAVVNAWSKSLSCVSCRFSNLAPPSQHMITKSTSGLLASF